MTTKSQTDTDVTTDDLLSSFKKSTPKKSRTTTKPKVRIVRHPHTKLPARKTTGAAGYDIYAHTNLPIWIKPGEAKLIPTGLRVALPEGYEVQVRSRSGLALSKTVVVLNSPGTVDSDYRDEIGVILINHGTVNFEVKRGDRIAQLVFAKYETVDFEETDSLDETDREGGFGSTGI